MDDEVLSRDSRPVPPEAVRVWRGFRVSSLKQDDFFKQLGRIFLPSTVLFQTPLGLTAYLPTILPADKPPSVPDEIALVFYESQLAYRQATLPPAGRVYAALHEVVFDRARWHSDFPTLFRGTVEQDRPYYLRSNPCDWQVGCATVFVGRRPPRVPASRFLASLQKWLLDGPTAGAAQPDGAIVVAAADYLIYWEHEPGDRPAPGSRIASLAEFSDRLLHQNALPLTIPAGLWDVYPGTEDQSRKNLECAVPAARSGTVKKLLDPSHARRTSGGSGPLSKDNLCRTSYETTAIRMPLPDAWWISG